MIHHTFMASVTITLLAAQGVEAQDKAADRAIPFPNAIDAASISVPRLDSILEYALILGNGDINALLYSEGGGLVLRLTKNDVWDARLDTSNDPPLPTLARIKELAYGEWPDRARVLPEGSKWSGPDSYHAHAYPCLHACALLRIGGVPAKPFWRRIRAEGVYNVWEEKETATVMSIQGGEGASNGYSFGPLDFSTDDYSRLRVRISGSENARFYIDVMGSDDSIVFATRWKETPTESEEQIFELAPGKKVGRIILYTWTEDGKRAENRFESVVFDGIKGKLPIDLSTTPRPSSSGRLDIRRAVAHAAGAPAAVPKADVRALADRNVFLIRTSADATLLPILSREIPPAATGESEGVAWLHQTIPGDLDWPGMSFAVALAANGDRKAAAIVTSIESKDVVKDAVDLARSTIQTDAAELVEGHEKEWRRFWSASGVDIEDTFLRAAWYRNLYFLRCVSKPGVIAPGLFASLVNDYPAWHGDYHTNYNIQQTFWTSYNTNHTELAEPYEKLVNDYLPRARWLARRVFDCDGAYYPHVLFAYEPSNPGRCKSRNGRQYIHHVWGFTIGVTGFTVQPLWWRYKYDPSRERLEKIAYPAVRDAAIFYAEFIGRCKADEKGKATLAPSVSPEHWGWTPKFERNRNCAFDIAMARYILEAAIEGATTLGRDAKLVERFHKALERLPDYPTTKGNQPVVVDVEDAPPIAYNIAVPAVPVFPGDVVTWWSPPDEKELFARTIEKLRWNGNNSSIILSVARARLSMPGTLEWVRNELKARLRPNGTLTLNRRGHGINDFGHYTEQFAASMAASELLLQSVGDIIRLFPAWPKDKGARFENLRAQGGFLISAQQKDGKIGPIAVTSTVGGKLRLLSPWKGISVQRGDGKSEELKRDERGVVELNTEAGDRLIFQSMGGY